MIFKNKKIFSLLFLGVIALSFVLIPLPFSDVNIANAQEVAGPPAPGCSIWDLTSCLHVILSYLGGLAMGLFGIVLGISGILLNGVMSYTIVDMSMNLRSLLQEGGGIYQAWTTLRDLANILFIFIILYIAIGTILRLDSINTKKLLVHVVIIALLLNFSLFFTKVIIDASNIVATSFHNAIVISGGGTGISDAFVKPMNMTSFYNADGASAFLLKAKDSLAMVFLAGFASILFLITAFVFFASSIMLISRYVILIFLMILSPLAFIAMALPKDEYSKKWWNALIDQALFAPVFLALLWIALMLSRSALTTISSEQNFAGMIAEVFTGNVPTGLMKLLINFLIVIGSILFALIAAKQIGGAGASGIMKWGKKAAGTALMAIPGRLAAGADKKLGGTRFGQTMVGSALRSPLGGIGKASVLGGKSGEKQNKESDEAAKKYAAVRTKYDIKKSEKIAEKKSGAAADRVPGEMIQEAQKTEVAIEANRQKRLDRIKKVEEGRIQQTQNNMTIGGSTQTTKQEITKIRSEATQRIQQANKTAEEKKTEAKATVTLSSIQTKQEKVRKEVYDDTKQKEKDKRIAELKKFKIPFVTRVPFFSASNKKRKLAAEFLGKGRTEVETDWDKLLKEVKEAAKKEEKGHGEDKGGGKTSSGGSGGSSSGGGGGGGGAHH
ncbi:MAG: hypothetical protein AAB534_03340 [Patescibacteria group bacterium]